MKRCPECRRDYYDETLLYCLDDGNALLEGPGGMHSTASGDGPPIITSTELLRPVAQTGVFAANSDKNAIAVLPFANMSRDEDAEYFSDGLAEELLNVLSKIQGLRVAGRTSAFSFKGKQTTFAEIGRELNVSSVLEGSVRMSGNRVRVSVKLVDTADGFHRWSETYDRTMDDIFAIQDDIANSVVEELREKLLGHEIDANVKEKVAEEIAEASKGRAADPEAHRRMLLGRYMIDRENEADLTKAVQYFREALEIDPGYALCWAELGRAYYAASGFGWHSLDTDFRNAEEALRQALLLEPALAMGHSRLARIRWIKHSDIRGADAGIKRSLALAPNDIDVLICAATHARELGRLELAVDYYRRALTIEPLSTTAWGATAYTHFVAGNLNEAVSAARRAIELSPQRTVTHAILGLIRLTQNLSGEALAEASLEPAGSPWRAWALSIIYHSEGRVGESDGELAKLLADFADDACFQIAEAHAMRGEIDAAFKNLGRAIELRDPGRLGSMISPFLKPLHDDPRWQLVLERIGFPEEYRR